MTVGVGDGVAVGGSGVAVAVRDAVAEATNVAVGDGGAVAVEDGVATAIVSGGRVPCPRDESVLSDVDPSARAAP